MTIPKRTPTFHINGAFVGLLVSLALVGCIKRQPLSEPVASEPSASEPSADATHAEVAQSDEPTGKWGQVQGVDILEGKGIALLKPGGDVSKVSVSTVELEGQDFDTAVSADVSRPSDNTWDVQLTANVPQAVERGDVLLASFYMRADKLRVKSGDGVSEFVFELNHAPWTKSTTFGLQVGDKWQKLLVGFKAEADYPAGEAQIGFRLGYEPQTLQIAGLQVKNFKKELTLADLPKTPITYPGMAPDAQWRSAAAERIDRFRKGDLTVLVKDAAGGGVSGASVELEMVRSDFGLGATVRGAQVLGEDANYQKSLEPFSRVRLKDDLSWPAVAGDWGQGYSDERTMKAVDALRLRGLDVRAGPLVQASLRELPKKVAVLAENPANKAELNQAVIEHIKSLVRKYKGKVSEWDVLSQPYDHHELLDILGEDVIASWFQAARTADPEAKLFLEGYGVITGGEIETPQRKNLIRLLAKLTQAEAPIDGIALRGHFGARLTPPASLLQTLDALAKFKKPVYITGLDLPSFGLEPAAEDVAAHYLTDFYTALFSHPAVGGIYLAGIWDGSHYMNRAPLYGLDWTPKPTGRALLQLLEDWRNVEGGSTDAAGSFKTRTFTGDYLVTATLGDKKAEARGTLSGMGSQIVVNF